MGEALWWLLGAGSFTVLIGSLWSLPTGRRWLTTLGHILTNLASHTWP